MAKKYPKAHKIDTSFKYTKAEATTPRRLEDKFKRMLAELNAKKQQVETRV